MKFICFSFLAICASVVAAASIEERATVQGFDISHYQASVNFGAAYNSGARFVIIKATEGTTYTDPSFSSHYTSATSAGLIRGGYHFARPSSSTGAAQATFFLAHGGGWSPDGITLPGMLDMEYNPSSTSQPCYGLSQAGMVAWVRDFVNTYQGRTGRWPLIYTSNSWWVTCTGDSAAFSGTCPLVLARYSTAGPGTVPGGWGYQTIWQKDAGYAYGGDSDVFNGGLTGLKKLASG
ncbi:MAG: hypothetical protein LQ344_007206 [Seirophora lacunosa]|nr:MAG: hypothetical protein LQ344_007206 [Seirophora lacunosa]